MKKYLKIIYNKKELLHRQYPSKETEMTKW